jgi:hypothetical protein
MILVDRWLQGKQNFIVGKVLYEILGTDAAMKNLFAKGESGFAKKKMVDALEGIRHKAEGGRKTLYPTPSTLHLSMPDSDDKVLHSLNTDWKEKYSRMNLLRHKLDEFGERNDDDARNACYTLCKEVCEIEQDVMFLWKQRDEYLQTGRLPVVKESKIEIPTDAIELGKFIENRKKDIRRNRKKMIDEPGVAKWAQMYNDHKELYKKATGKEYNEKK